MDRYLDMDPVALRTFVAVATHGSFTKAAATTGYTQPAVSRQMAALESTCGATLFTRGARGVRLTPAGEYLLPYARSLLDRLGETARALDAVRRLDVGVLRIGAFSTAMIALVPGALTRFRAAHPHVHIGLREGFTEQLLGMLAAGDLDLGIVSTHTQSRLEVPGARFTRLLDDPLLVALPRSHLLADRPQVALADLATERWIVADTPRAVAALEATCAAAGFRPDTSVRVGEWAAKLALVGAGIGVTLVPTIAAEAMASDRVVLRPVSPDPPRRKVVLAIPRHAQRVPAVSAFVAELGAGRETDDSGEVGVGEAVLDA
ncbi:MAG TPA: LysR family transcriptional regulator [Actinopolymorphaceae bacterium]